MADEMTEPHFNGPEYTIDDHVRLLDQHMRIKQVMCDGVWRTLGQISIATKDPEASISAQLRHLRKKRFGSYTVERKQVGDRAKGLFEYRVMPPGYSSEFVLKDRKPNKYREALRCVWIHKDTTADQRIIIKECLGIK